MTTTRLTLRELRKLAGLRQDELAGRVQIARKTLIGYERGKVAIPPHVLEALARELAVEPGAIASILRRPVQPKESA